MDDVSEPIHPNVQHFVDGGMPGLDDIFLPLNGKVLRLCFREENPMRLKELVLLLISTLIVKVKGENKFTEDEVGLVWNSLMAGIPTLPDNILTIGRKRI